MKSCNIISYNNILGYRATIRFNITTSRRFKCVPDFGVIKYSYIQAIVLAIVDYLPKNPRAQFLWFRCDMSLLFRILLLDWLFNPYCYPMSIKFIHSNTRTCLLNLLQSVGTLTSLLSVADNSGCITYFRSRTVLQRKQAWQIWSWLNLINTWSPIVFFIKYSPALKIIWRLKNCCGSYLLERFIHSVALQSRASNSFQNVNSASGECI